jgi:hypothetical protein
VESVGAETARLFDVVQVNAINGLHAKATPGLLDLPVDIRRREALTVWENLNLVPGQQLSVRERFQQALRNDCGFRGKVNGIPG